MGFCQCIMGIMCPCLKLLRPGRGGESQNDSESVANQANHSATSTVETEEHRNLAETIKQMNSVVESTSAENEKLKIEKKENEAKISSQQAEIGTKDSQINQLNSVVESKSEEIEKLERGKKEDEATISSQQAEIETKDSQINQLNSVVESKAEEIEKLEREKKEDEATISSQQAVIETKDSENILLKGEVDSKSEENEKLEREKKELEATIASQHAVIETKDAEIQNHKTDLNTTKKSLQSVMQSNDESAEQHKILNSVVNSVMTLKDNQHITTIRARIPKISELSNTYSSEETHFVGMKWHFWLHWNNNHLEVRLGGRKTNAEDTSCSAFYQLQLISQKDANVVHRLSDALTAFGFHETYRWGNDNFISFEDLHDEEKGYVKDDSIILAAYIKAFPAQ